MDELRRLEAASWSWGVERRIGAAPDLAIEARAGETRFIRGHAAVFNQLSEDLGGFREQISPGAFAEAIKRDDIRALFNHDPNFVLGRRSAGTLKLWEDSQGLAIEISPPDTTFGRDLVVSLGRGDITQMSFGFRVTKDGQRWGKDAAGQVIRTLTKVSLFDVSPVTFPAYRQTDVGVQSMAGVFGARTGGSVPVSILRRKLELLLLEGL